jgi:predicted deacetylase
MKLLVAIHDVSPAHDQAVQRIWRYCTSVGVQPALFVVPNWHGEWPIPDYRLFTAWLRDAHCDGAEIFLHGERHDELGATRELTDELRAFGRTDHEAEFLTLRYTAARERIERGLRCLRSSGLEPVGFVAPAWLAHADCGAVLNDCGLAISETTDAVTLHRRATRLASPVIRWSTRAAWRASASELVARAGNMVHANHWLVRIALHPPDVDHPATWSSVRSTIEHWLEVRHPWHYAAL